MQVSLLKLNSGISRAVETSATLERQNSDMEASIARLASGERIRTAADQRGMVTPAAGALHYLRVRPGPDARRAARRMRAPSDDAQGADGQRRGRARLADGAGRARRARRRRRPPPRRRPRTATTTPAATATPVPEATATPAPVTPAATAAPTTGGTTTTPTAPVG